MNKYNQLQSVVLVYRKYFLKKTTVQKKFFFLNMVLGFEKNIYKILDKEKGKL